MKTIAVAAVVLVASHVPLSAQHYSLEGCLEVGDATKESNVFRLCPKGVAYEMQYQYYGVWGKWKKAHPNALPCPWDSISNTWRCREAQYVCESSCIKR